MLSSAQGKILEIAVGAGNNFSFYPEEVEITAVDFSSAMLKKAEEAAREKRIQVEFLKSDIESIEFEQGNFDTVISTLSLCSYTKPIEMLNNISRWCKPGGQILLLEHGISTNRVFSFFQNRLNSVTYRRVGCHQNREIIRLINESNLTIKHVENHWFNSVHLVWATPNERG